MTLMASWSDASWKSIQGDFVGTLHSCTWNSRTLTSKVYFVESNKCFQLGRLCPLAVCIFQGYACSSHPTFLGIQRLSLHSALACHLVDTWTPDVHYSYILCSVRVRLLGGRLPRNDEGAAQHLRYAPPHDRLSYSPRIIYRMTVKATPFSWPDTFDVAGKHRSVKHTCRTNCGKYLSVLQE